MKKILIVEDNEINLNLIVEILTMNGYNVIVARDGVEAIMKAEQEHPDLILMDIQMPKMDGITAMKKIREAQKIDKIIALTAYAMKGDRESFIREGFTDYISKPIHVNELISVIKKYL